MRCSGTVCKKREAAWRFHLFLDDFACFVVDKSRGWKYNIITVIKKQLPKLQESSIEFNSIRGGCQWIPKSMT
jgi:hypothetical protein